MTALARLKGCSTLSDLALLLGMKPSALSYILYKIDDADKYYEFQIPKRSGGNRTIHAPVPALKAVQKRLASHLSACLEEISQTREVDQQCTLSHGFRRGFSIATNARRHRNRRFVFNIDLSDFFPSIHFGRVRGYFMRNGDFGLNEKVATVIAQIACRDGELPQGSPASPVISNLIGNILDIRLAALASANGCTYTRYADDISFSTNLRDFPRRIARRSLLAPDQWKPSKRLIRYIKNSGFDINPSKTRMSLCNSRQMVTGLVVNRVINVPSEYVKITRAMCDRLFKTGVYDYNFGAKIPSADRLLEPLHGRLSYIFNIKYPITPGGIRPKVEGWPNDVPGTYKLYRKFLDYKYFYGIVRPTIICEGKTDCVYLKIAMRKLSKKYPSLVITSGKDIKIIPKFFNYNHTSAAVQSLSGGFGEMQAFIARYKSAVAAFSSPRPSAPTIIVIDNDSGAKPIFATIKTVTKALSVDGKAQFYHIFGNLYVVPLPLGAKPDADIESFLPASVLKVKLGGKSFFKGNSGSDPTKHFGKAALADYVAKQPASAVSFSGFKPILDALTAVQIDYAKHGWR